MSSPFSVREKPRVAVGGCRWLGATSGMAAHLRGLLERWLPAGAVPFLKTVQRPVFHGWRARTEADALKLLLVGVIEACQRFAKRVSERLRRGKMPACQRNLNVHVWTAGT